MSNNIGRAAIAKELVLPSKFRGPDNRLRLFFFGNLPKLDQLALTPCSAQALLPSGLAFLVRRRRRLLKAPKKSGMISGDYGRG